MIKFVDLSVSGEEFDRDIVPLLKKIFAGGGYVGGAEVAEFESEFAEYCGTKYAVSVNSGTDALILALKALNIGEGDEVITVSNSFIATANSIVIAGAKPVFTDISPDLLIDSAKIEALITDKTRAIMPVHLCGQAADMDAIKSIAKKHSLKIIEDAAQSAGAIYGGIKTGNLGDIGCFSLHPLKNLGGIGDGGIITTNDSGVHSALKMLRNHGLADRDRQALVGSVSRLDTLNAAILLSRLKNLDNIIASRIKKADIYDSLLNGLEQIKTPLRHSDRTHTFHTYVVAAQNREQLIKFLAGKGIETKIHYPIPIHRQQPYAGEDRNLPVTDELSDKILTLPIANVSANDIEYVCESIKYFYRNNL